MYYRSGNKFTIKELKIPWEVSEIIVNLVTWFGIDFDLASWIQHFRWCAYCAEERVSSMLICFFFCKAHKRPAANFECDKWWDVPEFPFFEFERKGSQLFEVFHSIGSLSLFSIFFLYLRYVFVILIDPLRQVSNKINPVWLVHCTYTEEPRHTRLNTDLWSKK